MPKKKIRLLIVFGCLLTATLFLIVLELINYDKIVWGLKVADLNLGGKDINQAAGSLGTYLSSIENKEITLTYEDKKYTAKSEELGVAFDLNQSLKHIFSIGRQKNIALGLAQQVGALFGGYNLENDFSIDSKRLDDFISSRLSEIEEPAQNASLVYNKKSDSFDLVPAKAGKIIDTNKLKSDLIKIDKVSAISLTVINDLPDITDEEVNTAKDEASKLIETAPLTLEHGGSSWIVDKSTLAGWLKFEEAGNDNNKTLNISVDREKIKKFVNQIASRINREPSNAQLLMQDGKITFFSLAKKGYHLDTTENVDKIIEAVDENIASQKIILEAEEIEPIITSNDDITNLGLTSLLGQGESNFAGSPKNRIHNIKIGLNKMSGIIIKPGEEFSFNSILGEVGAEQDYLPELVIKKNKTVPEYGGGLCQVSTTVFRVAVNAGLKITERYPHPFPIKYYNPQGFDATIYPPHPDLRFVNDTPNHLLLQGRIEGSKIIFEIYGTSDGREVKVKGPTVYDKKPDGSMKAILYQEIWRNGQMEHQSIFRSTYKSPDLYPIEKNPLE